jgi:hypothetical protein
MESPAGKYCGECSIGVGCKIWDNVPKKCKEFSCAYNQVDDVPIDLRPDNCHIIFEKIGDNIFFGTQDPEHEITEFGNGQIRSFVNQGYSVVINKGGNIFYMIAEGHSLDIIKDEIYKFVNSEE